MKQIFGFPLKWALVIMMMLSGAYYAFGKLKDMRMYGLKEVPLSVPDSQLQYTPDGHQCPIVDIISDVNFTIESDSLRVVPIAEGKNKGYKRVFFDNIPARIKITSPGYDWMYLFLKSDTIPAIEYGKQYEILLLDGGGTPVNNHNDFTITVSPANLKNLDVRVDGEDQYMNQYQIGHDRLRYGLHRYRVTADGYKTAGGRFWITSRGPVTINVELTQEKWDGVPTVIGSPEGIFDHATVPKGIGGDNPPRGIANPNDPRENPPFNKEEKLFYGENVIKKYITDCGVSGSGNRVTPTSIGFENFPKQNEIETSVTYKPFSAKDVPVVMTPKVAAWVKINRFQYVGRETSAAARKKRYSSNGMQQFKVTASRRIPYDRLKWSSRDKVVVYAVDMDYRLYCLGVLFPTTSHKQGVTTTTTWVCYHWGEFYGTATQGPEDFYLRRKGGKRRYYGTEAGQFDIPSKIRGFYLTDSDWDAKNSLHLIKEHLGKKTFIW